MNWYEKMLLDPDPANGTRGGAIVDDSISSESFDTGDDGSGPALSMDDIMAPDAGGSNPQKSAQRNTGVPPGIKPKQQPTTKTNESEEQDETSDDPAGETQAGEEDNEDTQGEAKESAAASPKEGDNTSGSPKSNKRDYSPFDPDEVKALKKLPNREFSLVAPLLAKYKTERTELVDLRTKNTELLGQLAGKGIPQSWYEHPQAYTLTPEYGQIASTYNRLSTEQAHYQQQLELAAAGEEWTYITGYQKDGTPLYSSPIAGGPKAQGALMGILSQAGSKMEHLNGRAQSIREGFNHRHQSDIQGLHNAIDQEIAKLNPELKPKDEAVKEVHSKLPPTFKGHPMAINVAKLVSVVVNQAQMLDKLQKAQGIKAAAKVDRKLAGPGAGTARPAKPAIKGAKVTEFDLADILGDSE